MMIEMRWTEREAEAADRDESVTVVGRFSDVICVDPVRYPKQGSVKRTTWSCKKSKGKAEATSIVTGRSENAAQTTHTHTQKG